MRSVFFAIKHKLSPNNANVCKLSRCSNPKLHGLFVGHVHNKFFRLLVINSLSFNVFNITAVPKLSQTKTSDILERKGAVPKVLMNLTVFSAEIVDCLSIQENGDVALYTETWIEVVGNVSSDGQ
jgi:hypothetical protein